MPVWNNRGSLKPGGPELKPEKDKDWDKGAQSLRKARLGPEGALSPGGERKEPGAQSSKRGKAETRAQKPTSGAVGLG